MTGMCRNDKEANQKNSPLRKLDHFSTTNKAVLNYYSKCQIPMNAY